MSDMSCVGVYGDGTLEQSEIQPDQSIWDVFPGADMVIMNTTIEDVQACYEAGAVQE